eukprot:GHRR01034761.1.p1 GENE.GHRR01034761.1~~GHRR01034761.1.p1  ORF type:complete len:105 (-),score=3.85 GHRR01034761.1:135-449(-)
MERRYVIIQTVSCVSLQAHKTQTADLQAFTMNLGVWEMHMMLEHLYHGTVPCAAVKVIGPMLKSTSRHSFGLTCKYPKSKPIGGQLSANSSSSLPQMQQTIKEN